jgi:hypothetical protein
MSDSVLREGSLVIAKFESFVITKDSCSGGKKEFPRKRRARGQVWARER